VERTTASIREFARIVGVDPSAISRAAKGGERLSKSVTYENGNPRIIIYDGCLEWHQNKNHRKDRSKKGSGVEIQGILPREVSSDIESHYSALIRQAEYAKQTGLLMPAAKFQQEAAECFRACRDTLLTLPLTVSEVAKGIMMRLFRDQGEDFIQKMELPLDDATLQIRVATKQEVRKALLHAIEVIQDSAQERRATDEALNAEQ
jgi:hypothetical protein